MDLVLSDDPYPAGDPTHLLEWPWKYRKWICQKDSTHWQNVSAEEWVAVEQFAHERLVNIQNSNAVVSPEEVHTLTVPFRNE